ncbi:hypothetical protein ILUMI_23616 [Ignelater luminosus]|uniref:Uncharacterized protein n=1 Tax=Ignelater luminosus TaxID=2038154 RepID=A0A8K0CBR1_IGNLU|nr:hypothetical protein ILUMI_23616 [Ignelater luminosus]
MRRQLGKMGLWNVQGINEKEDELVEEFNKNNPGINGIRENERARGGVGVYQLALRKELSKVNWQGMEELRKPVVNVLDEARSTLYGAMQKSKPLKRKQAYLRLKKQKKSWEDFGNKMEADGQGNTKLLYRTLRNLRKGRKRALKGIEDIEGNLLKKLKEIVEGWRA